MTTKHVFAAIYYRSLKLPLFIVFLVKKSLSCLRSLLACCLCVFMSAGYSHAAPILASVSDGVLRIDAGVVSSVHKIDDGGISPFASLFKEITSPAYNYKTVIDALIDLNSGSGQWTVTIESTPKAGGDSVTISETLGGDKGAFFLDPMDRSLLRLDPDLGGITSITGPGITSDDHYLGWNVYDFEAAFEDDLRLVPFTAFSKSRTHSIGFPSGVRWSWTTVPEPPTVFLLITGSLLLLVLSNRTAVGRSRRFRGDWRSQG